MIDDFLSTTVMGTFWNDGRQIVHRKKQGDSPGYGMFDVIWSTTVDGMIHTVSSRLCSGGFNLLRALGHAEFFTPLPRDNLEVKIGQRLRFGGFHQFEE